MRAFVGFLIDKHGYPKPVAVKTFDGDYNRGYVAYVKPPGTRTEEATGLETKYRKSVTKILNSNDGYTYSVTNAAREIELLKDFPWDDTLQEVNDLHNVARPEQ